MENGVKVLSEYRLERVREMLDAARQYGFDRNTIVEFFALPSEGVMSVGFESN
jgi:hypothetical protein